VTAARLPDGWDDAVLALDGHFLQSSAWARVQEHLGHDVVVGADADWCWLGVVRRAGPVRYLYLPFGPSVRGPAALDGAVASAAARARRLGCAFVRFEPGRVGAGSVAATGARRVRSRQYEHTLVLALDGDEAALRKRVKSGHRSAINSAAKRGLSFDRTSDPGRMPEFVRLLRDTERRADFFSYEDPYFEAIAAELMPSGNATLYFAVAEGRSVAAALVFDFGETRYYGYGAMDSSARRLSPQVPLVWRAILDARERGQAHFDMWGVAPPGASPDHPWSGITYFKSAFGGEPQSYAGTWELTVRPVAARLFSLARSLRR
jgi:lipid II:glycine glycyltransferase (peptidoglycan interpeptide bridge formation enzyme)